MNNNKKTFYITTPIYYPSGNLHIGHLLTTTLASVYRNYKNQQGYETLFITGIDEHGQKIQKKALEQNITPKEYVDIQSQKFVDLWKLLKIDYDKYIRTTDDYHIETIQKVFYLMEQKGYIYKSKYEGLYSISDEEFLTKTQAISKDGKFYHPISGHELQEVKEESYFFNMSKFTPWIKSYFEQNPDFITNKATYKELMNNFINKGLEDLSITRVSFDWGIKIETKDAEKQHIIYVWLDALFNYLSALGYNNYLGQELYNKFWVNGNERVHLLAKEISRFHAIYWPIFLKSLDLNLPTKLVIHSWIVTPEGKMSKSKGNVIEPIPLIEKYGAEPVKYFFASQINIDNDFSFSEELLINVLNADLANNFGNLANRTFKMVMLNFENGTTYCSKQLNSLDKNVYLEIENAYNDYKKYFDNFNADKALKRAIELSKFLNEYIDKNEPWKLKENLPRLNVVLNTLLNGIYAVNMMLSVVLKEKCNILLNDLQLSEFSEKMLFNYSKFDNKKFSKPNILFERIKPNN
ncbi:methionine--tRNA ligase [Metamycoplasma hominis]|uniref:methionine--tRNA ligase n=1 Tax=Metamycoplasma hominis TaxID=2098 RepID=UPI0005C96BD0|nr:methionine--tRNA ligase [Metamycoplasma hominis]